MLHLSRSGTMWPSLITAVILAALFHGCTSKTAIKSHVQIEMVPELTPTVVVKILDSEQARSYLINRKVVSQGVIKNKIYDLFWENDLELDYVIIRESRRQRVRSRQGPEGGIPSDSYRRR